MKTPNTFTAPAILTRVSSRADGGLTLSFATNELELKQKAMALEYHNKFGWLLFKDSQIEQADVPEADPTDETKSPSQRLRACLFILWTQRGKKGDFEFFYRDQMEKITNKVKACLD